MNRFCVPSHKQVVLKTIHTSWAFIELKEEKNLNFSKPGSRWWIWLPSELERVKNFLCMKTTCVQILFPVLSQVIVTNWSVHVATSWIGQLKPFHQAVTRILMLHLVAWIRKAYALWVLWSKLILLVCKTEKVMWLLLFSLNFLCTCF